MKLAAAIERLERVSATRSDVDALPADLTAALGATSELKSFLASAEADLARRLGAASSFPEAAIAEVSRESLGQAGKTLERGQTLEAAPSLAGALDDAHITPGHIDALTRGAKSLEPQQRQRLIERVDALVDVATASTIEQFGRRIRTEASRIIADDGIDRFERQRRQTTLSTWTAVETLFVEATPDTCPTDPVEKQKHLRALAFARPSRAPPAAAGRDVPSSSP